MVSTPPDILLWVALGVVFWDVIVVAFALVADLAIIAVGLVLTFIQRVTP